ncbi:E3 ubiquitin-protein ligase MIB1 like protein [Argiope bruennichi]|uniref:E3 ubiquitin-protein ligase MIB1 like protein n=1 Tax=Argiope bruennichi TaxID=94029 RepID=A0A8T0EG52_ARGBR|nr:E3 ubiquitin-protein ligase MIB1 like protein [Argiope bruennichi]
MARSGTYLLHRLVKNDENLELLRDCLSRGMDPNRLRPYGFGQKGNVGRGEAPLHIAAGSNESNLEAVKELIKAGADVNLRDYVGNTPLHNAALSQKRDLVDFLIQSGASPNIRNFYGQTALHFAVYNHMDNFTDARIIIKLLQHEGIFVDQKDNEEITPLILAVQKNHLEAVEILLYKGADPNIANTSLETPLHVSLSSRNPNYFIVVQLLMKGAKIYKMDKNGQTPMDVLINHARNNQSLRFAKSILKIIVFRCQIHEDIKRKIEMVPQLKQCLIKCCEETEGMKKCLIAKNLTLHEFVIDCFQEDSFSNPVLQIYKPVLERLFQGFYIEYFYDIFDRISDLDLREILEITVHLIKDKKYSKMGDFTHLLSKIKTDFIVKFLSRSELFYLIVAVSNVRIFESLQLLHERHMTWLEYLNRKPTVGQYSCSDNDSIDSA